MAAAGGVAAYASRNFPQLLRWAPALHRLWLQLRARGGLGDMETAYLRLRMDYASGLLSGTVLAGRFAGKRLDELSLDQLLALHGEWQSADAASAALLETYLDRQHGADWRRVHSRSRSDGKQSSRNETMSRDEASEVLGLQAGASERDIVAAHRRLMQKFHPDRGGSDYLATRINLAKDVLLRK
ncbi:molecular chaperone DnaJ [Methylogaea oryzae]|uniref:molecular chaperone DnaJ n=1 Tax=Methylogaea oryzae TaxID=1295382 RepID=UPI0020D1E3CF